MTIDESGSNSVVAEGAEKKEDNSVENENE
jgi:hypothetical protein